MSLDELRQYCLSKKGVTEGFPFGRETLVFKVMDKIFAITSLEGPVSVNLKCDPELAVELREKYEDVIPGYHMNKTHWNTVDFEGKISNKELKKMVDHSYDLIVKGLSKKQKEKLN